MTNGKERPIIFNSEMVRAILEGRKTQTRRPMKHQPPKEGMRFSTIVCSTKLKQEGKHDWVSLAEDGYTIKERSGVYFSSPCGKPGDRLWVREAWAKTDNINSQDNWPGRPHKSLDSEGFQVVIYGADGSWRWCDGDGFSTERSHWKPSIHMPRWASRITLEITNVRVERVGDITPEDELAEGVDEHIKPISRFHQLWDLIYLDKGLGWDANPFVWVYEFRRVE